MLQGSQNQPLEPREQDRVDALLAAGRRAHHAAHVVAAFAIALASLGNDSSVKLPFGDVFLPKPQALVGAYLLSVALVAVADRYLLMALDWMSLDSRRPPFAWYVLGRSGTSFALSSRLMLVPSVIATVAAAPTLGTYGTLFLMVGWLLPFSPRGVERHIYYIRKRADHRGGHATLSIWLLQWLRLVRDVTISGAILCGVLAAVPIWRKPALIVGAVLIGILSAAQGIRLWGDFIYKRIDRWGARFGFPTQRAHPD